MAHLILGSVTELRATDVGRHVIVGSHCGAFTGEYASQTGVASLIAHDAGVGLDKAGIVGLDLLDAFKIPAATAFAFKRTDRRCQRYTATGYC